MSVLGRQSLIRRCGNYGMVRRADNLPLKIEPVSIDVHLDKINHPEDFLAPGEFCLGVTFEIFNMPDDVVGFVVGKSTIAREGLQIEAAGLIDPGFKGRIVLELKNLHHVDDFHFRHGDPIGQVYFLNIDQPVDVLYGPENGNHYQGQDDVTGSYRKRS